MLGVRGLHDLLPTPGPQNLQNAQIVRNRESYTGPSAGTVRILRPEE